MNASIDSNPLVVFEDIAEKEMLMYQAVIDMVQENYDINSIKVSDITGRAGIGKGTAYEYFSSKEEIIVKALLYDTYLHMKAVEKIFLKEIGFKDKYYLLMDFLENNMPYTKGVNSFMKMMSGTYEIKDSIKGELDKLHIHDNCPMEYMETMVDTYMEQGYKEGIFVQKNISLRRSVFVTQTAGYIFCLVNNFYKGTISREDARNFSYESIVKLLNP